MTSSRKTNTEFYDTVVFTVKERFFNILFFLFFKAQSKFHYIRTILHELINLF